MLFVILFGFKSHKAPAVASGVFSPTNEFKLDTWFKLGPVAFNKGVLYLLITVAHHDRGDVYIARRLQQRPGRLQVAVEMFYDFTRGMSRENLSEDMERKYFPLIATIFVFILVTNLIGYIPLPVDSRRDVQAPRREHPVVSDLRGRHERRLPADPRARRVRACSPTRGSSTTARSDTSKA